MALTPEQKKILANINFAEAGGGSDDEAQAVADVFHNRVTKQGFDKAVKGSSAYNKKSKQYTIAESGAYEKNKIEKKAYERASRIVDDLDSGKRKPEGYDHFENIKEYGEPSWAKGQKNFKDIGRQRFYVIDKIKDEKHKEMESELKRQVDGKK